MAMIALLAGDGIGPEVVAQARRVLDALDLDLTYEEALVGGVAYHQAGHPLPEATLDVARRADALLFGAVGDPTCDSLDCIYKNIPFHELNVGEWLYVRNFGSYTLSPSSSFNGFSVTNKKYIRNGRNEMNERNENKSSFSLS